MTPFFRSEGYESRLAASFGWQQDRERHDEEEETAFPRTNRSENPSG